MERMNRANRRAEPARPERSRRHFAGAAAGAVSLASLALTVAAGFLATPASSSAEDDAVRDIGSRLELFVDRWLVQDLNENPHLPWADGAFEADLCAVSVQYMAAPIRVVRAVARPIVTGGLVLIPVSPRMLPAAAVRIRFSLAYAGPRSVVQTTSRPASSH